MNVSPISDKRLKQLDFDVANGHFNKLKIIKTALCSSQIEHTFVRDNPEKSWKLLCIFHTAAQKNETMENMARSVFDICCQNDVFKKIKPDKDVSIQSNDGSFVSFNSLILHYQGLDDLSKASKKYSVQALKIFRYALYCNEFTEKHLHQPSLLDLCQVYLLSEEFKYEGCSLAAMSIINEQCKMLTKEQFENLHSDLSGLKDEDRKNLTFKASYHLLNNLKIPCQISGNRKLKLPVDMLGVLQEDTHLSNYLKSIVREVYINSEDQLEALRLSALLDKSVSSLITTFNIKYPLKSKHANWAKEAFSNLKFVSFYLDSEDLYSIEKTMKKGSSVFSNCKKNLRSKLRVFHDQKITILLPVCRLSTIILNGETEVKEARGTVRLAL